MKKIVGVTVAISVCIISVVLMVRLIKKPQTAQQEATQQETGSREVHFDAESKEKLDLLESKLDMLIKQKERPEAEISDHVEELEEAEETYKLPEGWEIIYRSDKLEEANGYLIRSYSEEEQVALIKKGGYYKLVIFP